MRRSQLAAIALRHDTAMSRAMLRALAWPLPWRFRLPAPAPERDPEAGAYEGIDECFRNATSPMDWARG